MLPSFQLALPAYYATSILILILATNYASAYVILTSSVTPKATIIKHGRSFSISNYLVWVHEESLEVGLNRLLGRCVPNVPMVPCLFAMVFFMVLQSYLLLIIPRKLSSSSFLISIITTTH